MITTTEKTCRYLAELVPRLGFDAAVREIRTHADERIAQELVTLERYVSGASTDKPAAELALYADLVREVPEPGPGSDLAGIGGAVTEARALARSARAGMLGPVLYPALLLAVAAVITMMWVTSIGPQFVEMFTSMGGRLPAFSQAVLDFAWLVYGVIVLLAVWLVLVVAGRRRLAANIEQLASVTPAWLAPWHGGRLLRAHDRWRVATVASRWAASGHDAAQAVATARRTLDASEPRLEPLEAEVALASELGLGAPELAHQREAALDDYSAQLALHRAITLRGLQAAIALLVAAITIAIYLPIFHTGAIV